tara:strand:- start:1757 stop:2599 length:843 start_codon:yes stop_codon:yes gene_type:complete
MSRWIKAIENLPLARKASTALDSCIVITAHDILAEDLVKVEKLLMQLRPWRKGPFSINELYIDSEWRSDMKWDRIKSAIGDLHGQRVLDIGSGNGYFGWRMIAANAKQVIGVDPTPLYCMQHLAIQHFLQDDRNWVLPLRVEEIPKNPKFDTVFSMGVIYHRNDPQDHVRQIFDLTQPGGRAVIESIVTMQGTSIFPEDRYARMRNIGCIPDQRTLMDWCLEAGFRDVKLIDVSKTTSAEQRSTKWMVFESLKEALDPTDSTKTVEGYPAPIRAAILAYK